MSLGETGIQVHIIYRYNTETQVRRVHVWNTLRTERESIATTYKHAKIQKRRKRAVVWNIEGDMAENYSQLQIYATCGPCDGLKGWFFALNKNKNKRKKVKRKEKKRF